MAIVRLVEAYDQGLREGKMIGSRCDCGQISVPPRSICGCKSNRLDLVEVEARGKLVSWTVIKISPPGFDAPYVMGIIELECGPNIMGVVNAEPEFDMGLKYDFENNKWK